MSEVVRPEGWNNWRQPEREKTSRYAEFNSTGPGANVQKRVPWARQLTKEEADEITLENVLSGQDGWNPKTGQFHSAIKVIPSSGNENKPKDTDFGDSPSKENKDKSYGN